jgi:hypothetical protein
MKDVQINRKHYKDVKTLRDLFEKGFMLYAWSFQLLIRSMAQIKANCNGNNKRCCNKVIPEGRFFLGS